MQSKGVFQSVIGGREMNQDSLLCLSERGLFAVADGVGGGLKGEVASRIAVETLQNAEVTSDTIKAVVESGQAAVLHEAITTLGDALMGTTLTSVIIKDDQATLCHVGDSRLYLYREGLLKQMTEDHEAYDEGLQASVLNSYLGLPPDIHPITILRETFTLNVGDKLLLCSDGLYRQQTEVQMTAIMKAHDQDPQKLADELCAAAANSTEYSDNVTVVYVEITA